MIYLASPYSSPSDWKMQERFEETREVVVNAFNRGIIYMSPIMYWHEAAQKFDMPTNHIPYLKFNMQLLRACKEIHLLTLDGWKTSEGMKQEFKAAQSIHLPYTYLTPAGQPTLILE